MDRQPNANPDRSSHRSSVQSLLGAALIACASFGAAPALAHEPMDLDGILGAFQWDFDKMPISTEKVADGLYVIFGVGGNIGVSIGDDGVLIVDDQFPEVIPKVRAEIRKAGGGDVDFAINTHWHFDHAEGNLALGKDGTILISHVNSRNMMLGDHEINLVALQYLQKAYPDHALPKITYDKTMQLFYNGQRIDLLHPGPAHTTGDTAVFFRGQNAVHLGDVFNNSGYPFIDADNGGELEGMIAFCEQVLTQLDESSIVIPGHGPVASYQDLVDYVAMLSTMRDRLKALIASGASFEEVLAAKPSAEFDERYLDPSQFLDRAWNSLLKTKP